MIWQVRAGAPRRRVRWHDRVVRVIPRRYLFPVLDSTAPWQSILFSSLGCVISVFAEGCTTRRRLKEGLKRERAQRERISSRSPAIGDGVIATVADGCVTFINHVEESLTGWTQYSMLNTSARSPQRVPNARAPGAIKVVWLASPAMSSPESHVLRDSPRIHVAGVLLIAFLVAGIVRMLRK